jgi:hypothetical protein
VSSRPSAAGTSPASRLPNRSSITVARPCTAAPEPASAEDAAECGHGPTEELGDEQAA